MGVRSPAFRHQRKIADLIQDKFVSESCDCSSPHWRSYLKNNEVALFSFS
jgi:hypothetical protein